ncbi:MAG TPA: sulfur carrier protein ThiS [Propionicimonas sp.]|jgi:thiamine biosynthesis protein ThiS
MTVNGQAVPFDCGCSLLDFLEGDGWDVRTIAVERNGAIVPRATYASVLLADTDALEIVRFVGGG